MSIQTLLQQNNLALQANSYIYNGGSYQAATLNQTPPTPNNNYNLPARNLNQAFVFITDTDNGGPGPDSVPVTVTLPSPASILAEYPQLKLGGKITFTVVGNPSATQLNQSVLLVLPTGIEFVGPPILIGGYSVQGGYLISKVVILEYVSETDTTKFHCY
jgi:hypothetical protein